MIIYFYLLVSVSAALIYWSCSRADPRDDAGDDDVWEDETQMIIENEISFRIKK